MGPGVLDLGDADLVGDDVGEAEGAADVLLLLGVCGDMVGEGMTISGGTTVGVVDNGLRGRLSVPAPTTPLPSGSDEPEDGGGTDGASVPTLILEDGGVRTEPSY